MYTLNSPCSTVSGLHFCDNGLMVSHRLKANILFNKNVAFVSICYHSDPDQMKPEASGKALLLTPRIKILMFLHSATSIALLFMFNL